MKSSDFARFEQKIWVVTTADLRRTFLLLGGWNFPYTLTNNYTGERGVDTGQGTTVQGTRTAVRGRHFRIRPRARVLGDGLVPSRPQSSCFRIKCGVMDLFIWIKRLMQEEP